jgi:hypothetical protein
MFACWAKRLVLVLLLLTITGGQWALLQSAAWAGMLANHLRSQSIATAMAQTFDGEHPCPICKAIAQGKRSEKKSDVEIKVTRLELLTANRSCNQLMDDCFRYFTAVTDQFAESIPGDAVFHPPC